MRVVAINTSPERESGIVSLLIEPFLDGLREAGAMAELCYACDLDASGFIDSELRERIEGADVLAIASPLFFDGFTGPDGATPELRRLLARLSPGTCWPCAGDRPGKVIIASGCGFWEIDGLWLTPADIIALCQNRSPVYAGDEPGCVLLRGAMPRGLIDWDVISAASEVGCQLVVEETSPPTAYDIARMEAVTRDFYDQIVRGDPYRKVVSYATSARTRCSQKED